jgi:hypothetical protein
MEQVKGRKTMDLSIPKQEPRTRKVMIQYLAGHARYHTMNSWNNSTSYAHCIKVDRLGLDHETTMACLEMLDVREAFDGFNQDLEEFSKRHEWRWQISQNGRSGGYLVLIQGGKGQDGRIFCWPGKSLDMGEDFAQWKTGDLRERVRLVLDFDQACRHAVTAFVEFARSHEVREKQIMVPKRIKVAVPRALHA